MSYTLNYTGSEIDDILDRAAPGGAIDQALATKQDALTFDAVPTEGSTNPAESGGIYDAIQAGGAAALAAFATDSVSGDVVSFPDGADDIPVKAFTGSIIPQQNLNGQSAPYPAGGGANKVDQSTLTNTGVVSDTGATGTQTTRLFSALFPVTPNTTYYAGVDGKSSNNETIQFNRFIFFDSSKTFLSRSATGQSTTGVNITTPANAYYASIDLRTPALTTNLVAANVTKLWFAVGSGTVAYSPYANICPISGWTGARLFDTGVNVWSEEWEQGAYNSSTGEKVVNSYAIRAKNLIPVKPNTDYFIKVPTVGARIFWYDINGAFISTELANNVVKTSPSAAYFLTFNVGNQSNPITSYANNISINYPSTDTDYHAYDGQTILLDFGQTVYAGTLTALGGGLWKIQPTHARVDMGTLTWTIVASGTAYERYQARGLMGVISAPADNYTIANAICDSLVTATAAHVANGDDAVNELGIYANGIMEVRYPAASTVADFISAMSGVYLVYPLATLPDPITITGEDLQTLLGANTVWLDCGSVTGMTYRADTALYIQKLLNGGGTLQTLSMASPSPSLSLGRVGVLAEPEADAEPEEVTEEPEADTEEATEE